MELLKEIPIAKHPGPIKLTAGSGVNNFQSILGTLWYVKETVTERRGRERSCFVCKVPKADEAKIIRDYGEEELDRRKKKARFENDQPRIDIMQMFTVACCTTVLSCSIVHNCMVVLCCTAVLCCMAVLCCTTVLNCTAVFHCMAVLCCTVALCCMSALCCMYCMVVLSACAAGA